MSCEGRRGGNQIGQIHGGNLGSPAAIVTPEGALLTTGSINVVNLGNTVARHNRTSLYTVDGFADTSTVHLDTGEVSAQTAFMLVDISDTTNWKHTNTDHVIIRHILLEADPDASYLGEIKVGFLSSVSAVSGTFNQIIDVDLAKKSDLVIEDLTFTGGFHCQASTHFGPIIADSLLFQTDVDLQGPNAATSFPSGNGDLVMLVEVAAGTTDVSVTLVYETVPA